MSACNVAILGASGLVGREFIRILEQRDFPVGDLRLLASSRSAGKKLSFKGSEITIEEAGAKSFKGIDIALFSAGATASRHFAPIAVESGASVVDNSSAFRVEEDVPLVVPEVNPEDIEWHRGIIANPNCSTIQMVVALAPLHKVNPIKRLVVATYQAVSGSGAAAVAELTEETRHQLEGEKAVPHVYPHQIAFNALPHIDVFLDDGYTKEEWKMMVETRKIMHAPEMPVSATCVRIPVYTSHSEAVQIELSREMTADEARRILSEAPGVKLQDNPDVNLYPMPWPAAGTDDVFVGRIRNDSSLKTGLAMWVVADNLRKGAALNTVQIAEEMIRRDRVKPRGG